MGKHLGHVINVLDHACAFYILSLVRRYRGVSAVVCSELNVGHEIRIILLSYRCNRGVKIIMSLCMVQTKVARIHSFRRGCSVLGMLKYYDTMQHIVAVFPTAYFQQSGPPH